MPQKKVQVPTVADSYEKYDTYRRNMERFNKARRGEHYLEALWILYAMIEDRTTSFLYHIGFVSGKKRQSAANKIKADIRVILKIPETKPKYGLSNISGKLNAIKMVVAWAQTAGKISGYQNDLRALITAKIKPGDLEPALDSLLKWCKIRNELVHALFNKKTDAVENRLEALVNIGYEAERKLGNAVKALKRAPSIRKRHNIQ